MSNTTATVVAAVIGGTLGVLEGAIKGALIGAIIAGGMVFIGLFSMGTAQAVFIALTAICAIVFGLLYALIGALA